MCFLASNVVQDLSFVTQFFHTVYVFTFVETIHIEYLIKIPYLPSTFF